jgi:hypothetical protein
MVILPGKSTEHFGIREKPRETNKKYVYKPISIAEPIQLRWQNTGVLQCKNHTSVTAQNSILRPDKESLGLKAAGAYKIPCEYGTTCIGETGCMIEEHKKEQQTDLRQYHPE